MSRFVFLFPGQGSQKVGMGRDFFEQSDLARKIFLQADEILGYKISRICFEGPEEELKLTQNTQPALLTVSYIVYLLLEQSPLMAAGHSLGEYSALVAAGCLRFEDALLLVHKRGRYMQEAVPVGAGAMAALMGTTFDDVQHTLSRVKKGVAEIANWNAQEQIVIAGHKEAVEEALEMTKAARSVLLPVSAPFHTSLMKPAEERLSSDLDGVGFQDLEFPIISNVEAKKISRGEEARDALKRQVSRPVLWFSSMASLEGEGTEMAIEVGPGRVLTGLMKRITRSWASPPGLVNVEDWESLGRGKQILSGMR